MKRQKNPDKNLIEFFDLVLEYGTEKAVNKYYEDDDENKPVISPFYHDEINENIYSFPIILNSEYIQVQIAAYVTSWARMTLYETMEKVLNKPNGQIYYCDTDSLVTNIEFPPEIVDRLEFGKWDLEDQLLEGIYLQAKSYYEQTIDGTIKIKIKGLIEEIRKQMTGDDFHYLLEARRNGQDGAKLMVKEQGHKNLIKLMNAWKTNKPFNHLYLLEKKMNFIKEMEKREILPDGNSRPWHYEGTEENNIEEFFARQDAENENQEEIDYIGMMLEQGRHLKTPKRNTKLYEIYSDLEPAIKKKYFRTKGEITIEEMAEKYEYPTEEVLTDCVPGHYTYYKQFA